MQLLSSLTRKYIMAFTGIGLVGFTVTHLSGNLLLLLPKGTAFNAYANKLASLGALLVVAEVGLIFMFLAHIAIAFWVRSANHAARPIGYQKVVSKGGPTKSTATSRNMIVTGSLLLIFVVLHVWHFKFGPAEPEGYVTTLDGVQVRDLYRWVVESFQKPWIVLAYTAAMIFLGLHVRHGFWSAFQSLGATYPKCSRPLYAAALAVAAVLAAGFILIPAWLYFDFGGLLK